MSGLDLTSAPGEFVTKPRRQKPKLITNKTRSAWLPTPDDVDALRGLMASHSSILSQSAIDMDHPTKLANRLFTIVSQITLGTFTQAYSWQPAWLAKLFPKQETPIWPTLPENFVALVASLDSALETLEKKCQEGYNYPPMVHGRRKHVSLCDFLVTVPPNSWAWSPWLQLVTLGDRAKSYPELVEGIRSCFTEKTRAIVDDIYMIASSKGKVWTAKNDFQFWSGAHESYLWWFNNFQDLVDLGEKAKLAFGSSRSYFSLIYDYAKAGGFIPFSFIYPGDQAWSDFLRWLAKDRGVKVPKGIR